MTICLQALLRSGCRRLPIPLCGRDASRDRAPGAQARRPIIGGYVNKRPDRTRACPRPRRAAGPCYFSALGVTCQLDVLRPLPLDILSPCGSGRQAVRSGTCWTPRSPDRASQALRGGPLSLKLLALARVPGRLRGSERPPLAPSGNAGQPLGRRPPPHRVPGSHVPGESADGLPRSRPVAQLLDADVDVLHPRGRLLVVEVPVDVDAPLGTFRSGMWVSSRHRVAGGVERAVNLVEAVDLVELAHGVDLVVADDHDLPPRRAAQPPEPGCPTGRRSRLSPRQMMMVSRVLSNGRANEPMLVLWPRCRSDQTQMRPQLASTRSPSGSRRETRSMPRVPRRSTSGSTVRAAGPLPAAPRRAPSRWSRSGRYPEKVLAT